jgi:translation elongation factor P/translation initiation factor 5A
LGQFASKCLKNIDEGTFIVNVGNQTGISDNVKVKTEKNARTFVKRVVENLQNRFPNVDLFKAAAIFDTINLPSSDLEFRSYGESELELLCTTYKDLVDYSKCVLEWDTFKETMKSSFKSMKLNDFVLKVVTDESLYMQYPALALLAEIVLVFPASMAEVERGFSYQNSIKSKSRNRLHSIHLDQLLRLRLNSPETHDFPLQQAYKNWVELNKRRYVVKHPVEESDSDGDLN